MATQILFGREIFADLRARLLALKFTEMNLREFRLDRDRLDLAPPDRRKQGKIYPQVGFAFYANGHRVKVWTTFEEIPGQARLQAQGWVIITRYDKAVHFSRPVKRTEFFVERLVGRAKVNQERILSDNVCPTCRRRMEVVMGSRFGSRYWECVSPKCPSRINGKPQRKNFNNGLSEESKLFQKEDNRDRDYYRRTMNFCKLFLNEAGIPYVPARVRRKGWKVNRPENLEG
jgi:hypothetical protein